MANPVRLAAAVLALCAHWAPATGQNVYRCGDSYSNQPCPSGVAVSVDDSRSDAQRAEREAATRRDARSADLLEKERLEREKALAPPAKPAAMPAAKPAARAASAASKPKEKRPEIFKAVAPQKPGDAPPKKKTAKKAAG